MNVVSQGSVSRFLSLSCTVAPKLPSRAPPYLLLGIGFALLGTRHFGLNSLFWLRDCKLVVNQLVSTELFWVYTSVAGDAKS